MKYGIFKLGGYYKREDTPACTYELIKLTDTLLLFKVVGWENKSEYQWKMAGVRCHTMAHQRTSHDGYNHLLDAYTRVPKKRRAIK